MKCPGCGSNMKVTAVSVFGGERYLWLRKGVNMNDTVRLSMYCPKQYDESDPCQVDGSYFIDVSGFGEWIKERPRRSVDLRVEDAEEVRQLREWKAEVERICRTMYGPNRDAALFIMTNEVEEE